MPRRRAKRTRQIRYSEALAREVCERIARGEVWSRIGGSKGMPDYSTIYYWRGRHPEFAEAYALARAAATEMRADKVLEVAEAATRETVQQDRLHVGSLKWHVSRADGLQKAEHGWKIGANQRLIIEVREFERAWRADGTPYVREVTARPNDGEAR
jgi:hypothetical protein